ncbi:hypothetical protein FA13DRAFT_1714975 [Coprinellus micaceus]|uniref:Uncharacterized protein n=1 Tax=Coprinellus micaceus TaxID=71717 RepID=A0A4Y7SQE9_COPMI|nr:hypothetical protein FA13DRAFT_1714975 [Coprinellus micaceus]
MHPRFRGRYNRVRPLSTRARRRESLLAAVRQSALRKSIRARLNRTQYWQDRLLYCTRKSGIPDHPDLVEGLQLRDCQDTWLGARANSPPSVPPFGQSVQHHIQGRPSSNAECACYLMCDIDQVMGQPETTIPSLPDNPQPLRVVQPQELPLDSPSRFPLDGRSSIFQGNREGVGSLATSGVRPILAYSIVIIQYGGKQFVVPRHKSSGDAFTYKEFQRLILQECSPNSFSSDTSSLRLRLITTELVPTPGEEVEISESAWPILFQEVKKVIVKESFGVPPHLGLLETTGQIWAWGTTKIKHFITGWRIHWRVINALRGHGLRTDIRLPVFGALHELGAIASVLVTVRQLWESQLWMMVAVGLLFLSVYDSCVETSQV